jgi:transposase
MFHWTDQKIMVHAFYCVLALTLTSLLQRELAQKNINTNLDSIMESLIEIKECILLYPEFKGQKLTVEGETTLTELDDTQKVLYRALELDNFRSN